MIDATGLDRVDVLGLVDDLISTITNARAIIVPVWRGGGTRLKALEALASARPVATTTLGVAGIGFRGGEHGLTADDPAGLADAVATLLVNSDLSQYLARNARQHVRAFAWERALAPAEELYREILRAD
jgi:glycosyltransferase involved in cell wall biosynthesis